MSIFEHMKTTCPILTFFLYSYFNFSAVSASAFCAYDIYADYGLSTQAEVPI